MIAHGTELPFVKVEVPGPGACTRGGRSLTASNLGWTGQVERPPDSESPMHFIVNGELRIPRCVLDGSSIDSIDATARIELTRSRPSTSTGAHLRADGAFLMEDILRHRADQPEARCLS